MALFRPVKAPKANILTTPIVEGQFLTATDTGEMFLDVNSITRIQCGGGEGGNREAIKLRMSGWGLESIHVMNNNRTNAPYYLYRNVMQKERLSLTSAMSGKDTKKWTLVKGYIRNGKDEDVFSVPFIMGNQGQGLITASPGFRYFGVPKQSAENSFAPGETIWYFISSQFARRHRFVRQGNNSSQVRSMFFALCGNENFDNPAFFIARLFQGQVRFSPL